MRRLSWVVPAMVLSWALVGCGSDGNKTPNPVCGNSTCELGETAASCPADCSSAPGDCDNACAYVYGTCSVSLVDTNSNPMTEGQCVTACGALTPTAVNACVQTTACDTTAIVACFQAGPPPTTDCDNACAAVYQTCSLTLLDTNSNPMTEGQCVTACLALARSNMEACVTAASCDSTAVVSCFQ